MNQTMDRRWCFAVDRGGTFTDVVGLDPEGNLHAGKLPSSSPAYQDASLTGIRRLLGLADETPLSGERIAAIRFGTTVATNALLERQGEPVMLVVNRGFRDLLAIGHQARPDLFALAIQSPERLYAGAEEISGRLGPDGQEEEPLNEGQLHQLAAAILRQGFRCVAVVLLHAWRNGEHENRLEEIFTAAGLSVTLSHRTVARIGIVGRGQTTLVDAYLSVILQRYLDSIRLATAGIQIEFMQSDGNLSRPELFFPRQSLLSGPAGGAVAVAGLAGVHQIPAVVGFDMGGTSTDVCRAAGGIERIKEKDLDGIPVLVDRLHIVTVAAGGGSIIGFDGVKLTVGPRSAGADPGPACYGLGGPLTVTDANLFTGRLLASAFPRAFGPDRASAVEPERSFAGFVELSRKIDKTLGPAIDPEELALGVLELAEEKMALAIREVSVRRGFDPRDHALVVFGGAGGQHACGIARRLGIREIYYSPLAGVFSAWGIASARAAVSDERMVLETLSEAGLEALRIEGGRWSAALAGNQDWQDVDVCLEVELRRPGREAGILLEMTDLDGMIRSFREEHLKRFGYQPETDNLEMVRLCVTVSERTGLFSIPMLNRPLISDLDHSLPESTRIRFGSGWVDVPVCQGKDLRVGERIAGPLLVADPHATLLIEEGFAGTVLDDGTIELKRSACGERGAASGIGAAESGARRADGGDETTGFGVLNSEFPSSVSCPMPDASCPLPDPVRLEVFSSIFQEIASEMGHALQQTAESVNIRERLDFSCALFDAGGELLANAPHIPVHLGAMGETVKAVLADCGGSMADGDFYVSNDPYRGGSHLPDITVVGPVYHAGEPVFFIAARGHHADMGGIVPGSMPAFATHIDEEGVCIPPRLLVREGKFLEAEIRDLLLTGTYPVRDVPARLADLRAQAAACHRGREALKDLIARFGVAEVQAYAGHVLDHGAHCVQRALSRLLAGRSMREFSFADALDDGTPVCVKIQLRRGRSILPTEKVSAIVDFSGTGPQHDHDSLNAPRAVTVSALLYVLRLVTGEEIPLNGGCLRSITLFVPPHSLLDPQFPAPVSAGNVETSQRVVDVLLGALGVAAASQGTMNNLLFQVDGDSPYYETIGGGSGATADQAGASGVQVHMTNTRITDPEILETRHPDVRLDAFHHRQGSGGNGKQPGGDGLVREIRFLKPATVTILSERRERQPFGMSGGEHGQAGNNYRRYINGDLENLPHRSTLKLEVGESVRLETPGGGGWGEVRS